jgi:magnesium transporter
MIRTLAVTHDKKLIRDLPLERLEDQEIAWYWVDFSAPAPHQSQLLSDFFHFHPLAIEDCLHFTQRPKLDIYDDYHFFVIHALNQLSLKPEEVDLFVGSHFVVSFHLTAIQEIDYVWERLIVEKNAHQHNPMFIAYLIMDKLVDHYFPAVHQLEANLDLIEENRSAYSGRALMNHIFDIRGDLLQLRRSIVPMRDLLYRIVQSERLETAYGHRVYFTDIYDHLIKLSELVDSLREMTSDLRDSYISLNSYRMNTIMMVLTVITVIFSPLTFIAGIYGMNFEHMPELKWPYGYPLVLLFMGLIALSMILYFKRKGWFDQQ